MPETNIGSAVEADLTNVITDYEVTSVDTEGPDGEQEFTWQNTNWSQWLGYYKTIPELQTAVDAKATWTMGAGFEADDVTTLVLMTVKGTGKDTFNTIISNMIRTYTIGGDAFCEIILDPNQNDKFVNLKPLDPSSIKIVYGSNGRIKRYEQVSKNKKPNKRFTPNQIFHLSRKRIADEVHGISVIPAVEWIILARNEAMSDWKKVLHRNVSPLFVYHLDTDDVNEIAAFKVKMDKARADGENMYVPKGVVEPELINVAANSGLNPLQWINQLNDYFFQCVNVPQIIVGNAKEFTDASGKIVYLAYEQSVKGEQLYVEEQVLNQLSLEIHLTFPASMQQELISDEAKQPEMVASQPSDTTAEMEGKE